MQSQSLRTFDATAPPRAIVLAHPLRSRSYQPSGTPLISKTLTRPRIAASWDPPPGASRAKRDPPARSAASTGGRTACTHIGGAAPFHELAYEGYVLTNQGGPSVGVFSDHRLTELLGAVDVLHVSGYSAQVTGTSPQLTVYVQCANDRHNFQLLTNGSQIINALSLSTSGETQFQGVHAQADLARLAYSRLNISITGTDARAFLRIWVTGRDRSHRSAGSPQPQAMVRQMSKMANGNGHYGPRG